MEAAPVLFAAGCIFVALAIATAIDLVFDIGKFWVGLIIPALTPAPLIFAPYLKKRRNRPELVGVPVRLILLYAALGVGQLVGFLVLLPLGTMGVELLLLSFLAGLPTVLGVVLNHRHFLPMLERVPLHDPKPERLPDWPPLHRFFLPVVLGTAVVAAAIFHSVPDRFFQRPFVGLEVSNARVVIASGWPQPTGVSTSPDPPPACPDTWPLRRLRSDRSGLPILDVERFAFLSWFGPEVTVVVCKREDSLFGFVKSGRIRAGPAAPNR